MPFSSFRGGIQKTEQASTKVRAGDSRSDFVDNARESAAIGRQAIVFFTKLQFFLSFAVMGALVPFMPLYFREVEGFRENEIGWTMGLARLAMLLAPAIITFLADARIDPRRILAVLYVASSSVLIVLSQATGFMQTTVIWFLFSLAFASMLPLQDGVNFSLARIRATKNLPVSSYQKVRVWGTIGFILPSIGLFFLIRWG